MKNDFLFCFFGKFKSMQNVIVRDWCAAAFGLTRLITSYFCHPCSRHQENACQVNLKVLKGYWVLQLL